MANVSSLQIFFRSRRDEFVITDAWTKITGIKTESIDFPNADAVGFVQFGRYTEGFAQSALFSWPSAVKLPVCESELIEKIARKLNTAVLLESIERLGTWLAATGNAPAAEVEVIYLDDGIELID